MTPKFLSGVEPAQRIKENIKDSKMRGTTLAIVRVGDNPASAVYVKNKIKDCQECGIPVAEYHLPEDIGIANFCNLITDLGNNNSVSGIIVQKPLPADLPDPTDLIPPHKDIDCFNPENVGKMFLGHPSFLPCTPAGVMQLLNYYNIDVAGKNCVVIGRSNIVGKPMAALLTAADATVTLCHSKTKDLEFYTKNADLIVCAIGIPKFLKADMIKEGAILIDVGINRNEDGVLCGDIDFDDVYDKCGAITPVPGGVGLMTRAILLQNWSYT